MSYWLPKLIAAGLPTPKTTLLPMSRDVLHDIYRAFDCEPLTEVSAPWLKMLDETAQAMGYPVFLRTGLTSAKHNWDQTCFLSSSKEVRDHVIAIVEFSEMMGGGLLCDWWAVRELLPTLPVTYCPNYGNMPVCREFRFFVNDGEVLCQHPYWPEGALEQGGAADAKYATDALAQCAQLPELAALASRAGAAVGGSWSVDLLETARGWYVIDMAEAHVSWHWPDCAVRAPHHTSS